MRQGSAASTVAGILGFTFSFAARIATFGSAMPMRCSTGTAFFRISALSCSVGAMVMPPSVMKKSFFSPGSS